MYNYAGAISIFDDVSNMYMLSTATVFLAVIIALYCANFLKDNGGKKTESAYAEEAEMWQEEKEMLNGNDRMQEAPLGSRPARNSSDSDSELESDADVPLGEGLVGKLKTARNKQLEEKLTQDQLEEERRIEREQLAAIFELLKKQEAELNMQEIDEHELAAQLKLYR